MSASDERPVVLVTGAAGGLGGALVEAFSTDDWRVAAAGHSTLPSVVGAEGFAQRVDVTRGAEVRRWVEGIESGWGRIDVLVNNAGAVSDAPLFRMEDADWNRVLDVNLKGAFLCSQAVLPSMLRRRAGLVLNVASFAGKSGARGQANYASAKAALIGFTLSLAKEVGGSGIRANAVLPGLMRTGMTAALSEESVQAFAAANELGRWNEPATVARFIVAIARMKDVSGQVFQLDSRVGRWA